MAVLEGDLSGNVAEVSTQKQLKIMPETSISTNPDFVGAVRVVAENDEGIITGTADIRSLEIDTDYRLRVSQDLQLDEEIFNYTAQNTGKHSISSTTMTAVYTVGNLTLNAGSSTSATIGAIIQTKSYFPVMSPNTLSGEVTLGFTGQPVTNVVVDFGFFLGGANPYAPVDGVYFRLNSLGLQGIANYNGTETSTGIFPSTDGTGTWTYTSNKKYQYMLYITATEAVFWVNDGTFAKKLGSIDLPSTQARMCAAVSLPFCVRQGHTGLTGAVLQTQIGSYSVRQGGVQYATNPSTAGNRIFGSYQGLSGGTMGSLANYANSANPTAAVPTNTTAALGTGLGGQFWETDTLAANTDGIICSFSVPVGTSNYQARRLVIRGIGLTSHVQTALTGGGYVAQYSLAFGHTAVSLATGEASAAKAPRRIPLSAFTQPVTSGQAVATIVSQPGGAFMDFGDAPIYVNPGEFVALVKKKIGTAPSAGVIAHVVTFVYGWE